MALSANPPCMKRWQTLGGIFSLIVETRLQGLGKVLNYGCFCIKSCVNMRICMRSCTLVHVHVLVCKHKYVACNVQMHMHVSLCLALPLSSSCEVNWFKIVTAYSKLV